MDRKSILAIRIRSNINAPQKVRDTLKLLRVERVNYATLIDDRNDYKGMLQKAKDYITWGEVDTQTILLMLKKRGQIDGRKKLNDEIIKNLGFNSLEDLANALYDCSVEINKLPGVKPFFRLHPPKKGYKNSVKRPYNNKGELGYRGEEINKLARRMC
jgi:large subunit ribosomal protein L30